MSPLQCNFVIMLVVVLLFTSCTKSDQPEKTVQPGPSELSFTDAVGKAEKVILFEGLPHQNYERKLLEKELKSGKVVEINDFPFYKEPLTLTKDDASALSKLFSDSNTLPKFSGEKKCGGFHPDFAVEWHVGDDIYRALICFGCGEAKVFGPKIEKRHDLGRSAKSKLRNLLMGYGKNRPTKGGKKTN
jgi:hypothetical protein